MSRAGEASGDGSSREEGSRPSSLSQSSGFLPSISSQSSSLILFPGLLFSYSLFLCSPPGGGTSKKAQGAGAPRVMGNP